MKNMLRKMTSISVFVLNVKLLAIELYLEGFPHKNKKPLASAKGLTKK